MAAITCARFVCRSVYPGRERSRDPHSIVEEAQTLFGQGLGSHPVGKMWTTNGRKAAETIRARIERTATGKSIGTRPSDKGGAGHPNLVGTVHLHPKDVITDEVLRLWHAENIYQEHPPTHYRC